MWPSSGDFWISFNIFLSAATYLFDFATTILVAVKYYRLDEKLKHENSSSAVSSIYAAPSQLFPSILTLIALGNTLRGLMLIVTLPPQEQPLKQAFFLPVIQLWRLAKLFYVTSTLRGAQVLESEMKPIYNVLALSLEAGPQFLLQFYGFLGYIAAGRRFGETNFISLSLSVSASFISALYNGAIAVSFAAVYKEKLSIAARLGISLAGGIYVVVSLFLRAEGIMTIALYRESKYRIFVPVTLAGISSNFAHLLLLTRKRRQQALWHRGMECMVLSCMSFTVGPLYAMLRADRQSKEHYRVSKRRRHPWFYLELSLACSTHLLLDVVISIIAFFFIFTKNTQWCTDFNYMARAIRLWHTGRWECVDFYTALSVDVIVCIISVVVFVFIDMYTQYDAIHQHNMNIAMEGKEEVTQYGASHQQDNNEAQP